MKQIFLTTLLAITLTGCSLLPRDHDPIMVDKWVDIGVAIEQVECGRDPGDRGWSEVEDLANRLAIYTEFRDDPQKANIRGLQEHARKMAQGGSIKFCDLGKKSAQSRLNAARSAWSGR